MYSSCFSSGGQSFSMSSGLCGGGCGRDLCCCSFYC